MWMCPSVLHQGHRDWPQDWTARLHTCPLRGMLSQVVGSLMHEIECILHEYLSFNWDRVEEIFDANSVYLAENGLKCPWYSNGHLPVGACLTSPTLQLPFLTCEPQPDAPTGAAPFRGW